MKENTIELRVTFELLLHNVCTETTHFRETRAVLGRTRAPSAQHLYCLRARLGSSDGHNGNDVIPAVVKGST